MTIQAISQQPLPRAIFPGECRDREFHSGSTDVIEQFRTHWCKRSHLPDEVFDLKIDVEAWESHLGPMAEYWRKTRWSYDCEQPPVHWQVGPDQPRWFNRLCSVFETWEPTPDLAALQKDLSFAPALVPFMNWAWRQLESTWPDGELRIKQPLLKPQLLDDLCQKLTMLCHRVLVLELNVARLEERLRGQSPTGRFLDFRSRILGQPPGWQQLFAEYQVLARLVSVTLERWVENTADLLGRIARDLPSLDTQILTTLSDADLVSIKGGLSDPHCGGQGVWLLGFQSADGERQQVVYKPKSMAIDDCFHNLLGWINERAAQSADSDFALLQGRPVFQFPITLDRGAYGWSSFVVQRDADSKTGVSRFYWRQGAYLALLHLLGATDFHHENLIAQGEYPVLVDLETLLHPAPDFAPIKTARDQANAWLSRSVMHTGMLPRRLWGDQQRSGVNLGGLGSAEAQTLPRAVPDWEGSGTDEMRQVRVEKQLTKSENLPGHDGSAVSVTDHVGELIAGFQSMYRFIKNRELDLTSQDGPLMKIAGVKTRVVLRGTKLYSNLLYDGLHPDHMRHGFDRDNLMDHLWSQSMGSEIHQQLIAHEKRDMRDGDVPYFSIMTDATELRNSHGEAVCQIQEVSAHAAMLARLESMGEEDLTDQCFVIQGAIGTIMGQHQSMPASAQPSGRMVRPGVMAQQLGNQLLQSAFCGESDVSWLSMDMMPDGAWSFNPTGAELYGGIAGIGWFLSHLNADDPSLSQVTQRIYDELGRATAVPEFAIHGGYIGTCSMIYAMIQMKANQPDLGPLPQPGANLRQLADNVEEDRHYDVIAGSAGTLMHALAIHRLTHSEDALHLAINCARYLVESACQTERGCYWPFEKSPQGLLGFSHGNAGIAAALAQAAQCLRENGRDTDLIDPIERTIKQALSFERSHFDPVARNWPDLRVFDDRPGPSFECQWCHGAPGVGLGRALLPDRYLDSECREEIRMALFTMLDQPMIGNHCLCHGVLGNLWVARVLVERLGPEGLETADGQPSVGAVLDRWARHAQSQIHEQGPLCGIEVPIQIPGLMSGLAGIGLALLSLEDPGSVCNPMTLAYPEKLVFDESETHDS